MKFNKSLKILIGLILLVVFVMLRFKVVQLTAPKSDCATSAKRLAMILNNLTPTHWTIQGEKGQIFDLDKPGS